MIKNYAPFTTDSQHMQQFFKWNGMAMSGIMYYRLHQINCFVVNGCLPTNFSKNGTEMLGSKGAYTIHLRYFSCMPLNKVPHYSTFYSSGPCPRNTRLTSSAKMHTLQHIMEDQKLVLLACTESEDWHVCFAVLAYLLYT